MPSVSSADKRYLINLVVLAFSLRAILSLLMWVSDAIRILNLSPDSGYYHRSGILIAREMQRGFFNWPNWIDNGWFQFTGFVYFLLGPHPGLIQTLNIVLGSATVIVVFYLAMEISRSSQVARISALLVAIFPSFIFWSCLMIKDPVAIFMMCLLVFATLRLRRQFSFNWLLLMLLALIVFLGIREYMFFVAICLVTFSMFVFTPYQVPRFGSWLGIIALAIAPWLMGFGPFGLEYFISSMYLDLDYINTVRIDMGDHGAGAIFEHENVATWGSGGWLNDIFVFLKGLVFFFVTLDLTNIGSVRQIMALPEVLLTVLLLPYLARGLHWLWLDRRNSFPLLVFAFGIMIMLISATTNLGALFRWRMQVMPLFVIAMTIGVFYLRRGALYKIACKLTGDAR